MPSTKKTIAYFASLGYLVEKVVLRGGNKGGVEAWKITGKDCPLDGREFYTRLELWAEWLDYSAERIYAAAIVEPIKSMWAGATEEERANIIADLREWKKVEGHTAPWIEQLVRKASWGVDNLPRDWKAKMALLLKKDYTPIWSIVDHLLWKSRPKTS
ncbi:hypothetical protein [Lysobacter hankyongensis]|uniref:hypothetical protein n=1 Tax=Lysobacter hankyongensis TaxID=1176535 RepID=UPI0031E5988E